MGYYSTLNWEVVEGPIRVNVEKKKELERFFSNYDNEKVFGFGGVEIEIDESGELIGIGLEEYHAKFYDDFLFAKKLSEVIETGKIRLFFNGEDGDTWGYEVSPGNVESLVITVLSQKEYVMERKIIILIDDNVADTQKKLNQWIARGYDIKILAQNVAVFPVGEGSCMSLITTVERIKKRNK